MLAQRVFKPFALGVIRVAAPFQQLPDRVGRAFGGHAGDFGRVQDPAQHRAEIDFRARARFFRIGGLEFLQLVHLAAHDATGHRHPPRQVARAAEQNAFIGIKLAEGKDAPVVRPLRGVVHGGFQQLIKFRRQAGVERIGRDVFQQLRKPVRRFLPLGISRHVARLVSKKCEPAAVSQGA
ncbi:MAG: hypothetical protein ACAH80_04470 [Alphaproteobacteria bacterium]